MSNIHNPGHTITEYMPYVAAWLLSMGCKVEDVTDLTVNNEIVRDKEREARENDGYHWHKATGNQTVSLTLGDTSFQRVFTKSEREAPPSGDSPTKK